MKKVGTCFSLVVGVAGCRQGLKKALVECPTTECSLHLHACNHLREFLLHPAVTPSSGEQASIRETTEVALTPTERVKESPLES